MIIIIIIIMIIIIIISIYNYCYYCYYGPMSRTHIAKEKRELREAIFDLDMSLQPPHPGPYSGVPCGGIGSGAIGRGGWRTA
jgi:hypothetical protein